jgi:hypothetical protein
MVKKIAISQSLDKESFSKWIKKQVDFFVPHIGLQLFEINIEEDKNKSYLAMTCNYPYLQGTIKYSEPAFKDWASGKMRRERILHELCHIITDPLYVKGLERYTSKGDLND